MVEPGQAWGWNGEECVQEMQPEPKGTIPTTAAKLCQPRPKRNTREGRKPAGSREAATSGSQEAEGHLGPAGQDRAARAAHQPTRWSRSGEGGACREETKALAAQVRPATCTSTGSTGNQWTREAPTFTQCPYLSASGVAPIGQTVSSSESRGMCQALETE